ncbi:MAG: transcription termination/antitermination NusG family protein [Opitutales bacterium]
MLPGNPTEESTADASETANWFCLRSQPKRERVAAGQLVTLPGVDVFLPMVRFHQPSAKGKRPRTEPMFPNYLFARFDPGASHRAVRYAKGVSYIVQRGEEFQQVDPRIISELRAITVEDILELTPEPLFVGNKVKIVRGIFAETEAEVIELRPAAERVVLLLELLGRPQAVELGLDDLDVGYRRPDERAE